LTAVVNKARHGDSDALLWLYRKYNKAMFNICIRMAGSRPNAEDILQEAFLIAFKNLYQLKTELQFGGWLRRIVVNECIRFSKKNFSWDSWNEETHENITGEETEWWKEIEPDTIHGAIKNLPDGCRQVFNLFVLENFSHKQIAQHLNISESTSKSQYHRARQLLKQRIVQQLQADGQV